MLPWGAALATLLVALPVWAQASHVATPQDLGSLAWELHTGGRLTNADRWRIAGGMAGTLAEGLQLARFASQTPRRDVDLTTFGPPDTPMVRCARAYLVAHASPGMVNHSMRTAYWTLGVLNEHVELTAELRETAWVAALLHDVGLEVPRSGGDFSQGGVEVLQRLAREQGWSKEQTYWASEAITSNLGTHVDAARLGLVAWAMNVGGLGEIGFPPHRAQLAPARVARLEARYPRTGLRDTALRLIDAEARQVPDGRMALLKPVYWLIMFD